jgi:hypothetical protein
MATDRGDVWRASLTLPRNVAVEYQLLTTGSAVWRRDRPARAGSAWRVECGLGPIPGQPEATRSSPVTTPCGKFEDVLLVRVLRDGALIESWYAAGVGLVRRADHRTGVTETLVGYEIARAGQ